MTPAALSSLMLTRGGSIDPRAFPEEVFDLYSIPAYDARLPERVMGADIGSTKQVVEPGDVLLSKIVPHIRRAWTVAPSSGRRLIASGEWIVFRGSAFEPAYLRHFVLSELFHAQFMQTVAGVGGSLMRARPVYVGRIGVPLPPLEEQRRIAVILDQADALRTRRKECIDRSERFVASIFRDAASAAGTRRLPLGRVGVSFSSGRSIVAEGGQSHPSNRVLKVSAVSSGRFLAHEAKPLPDSYEPPRHHEARPGDWLFTRASGSVDLIGVVAQVPPGTVDLYLPDKLWRVEYSADSLLRPECFAALVKEPRFRSFVANAASGASGVRNVSQAKVLRYEVDVPPIDEQARFAARFEASQKVRARAAEQTESLDCLFASLQDRAFKGEL